jgi:hypothetical protein
MTCGGSHLGFPIGIKNRGPSNDHSWAVWFQLSKWFQRRSILKHFSHRVKAKLCMNVHWMVLYKLYVFCSDMKFKMAATAGLSLTLDPMGKMFQNASSLKPLGQLKPVKQKSINQTLSYHLIRFGCIYFIWNRYIKPEALKSLYRSPGYKRNQLVLCKNYVLQW